MHVTAVVLAGGTGTRMYPASSDQRPKQFLSFGDGPSLLTRTVERASEVADTVYVLTRPDYADAIPDHAPDAEVLTEPAGRDTGPALVYAAHEVREREGEDTVMLCLPSDHSVEGDFGSVAERACEVAADTDALVTLGVEPDRAATGYGYIKPGEEHDGYYTAAGFFEKPDAGAAERYRYNGFLWNAGMFAWTPEAFLAEARRGDLAQLVKGVEAGNAESAFRLAESVSVDYAVLEDAREVAVVPATFEWDDLGAWDALVRVFADAADDDGNVVLGDALTIDTEDCVIAAGEDQHVSAVGVSDLTVAAYDGNVLVVPTRQAQRVREVVDRLRDSE
ncbi:mannose-1-phosphate guanylyltransferase [Halomarina oriensis]|uniref:NTP transferase domain-containing protein n=1 Tax=Halomarina oriensis TaxID=671145 RepID=A0A6B0GM70_9EURY|nr:sugar phosphate nucleotidyltransferase [Halomarina oriensis]MWG34579.1 NTP transferase domain-containing protein [Halomarina oriensis]